MSQKSESSCTSQQTKCGQEQLKPRQKNSRTVLAWCTISMCKKNAASRFAANPKMNATYIRGTVTEVLLLSNPGCCVLDAGLGQGIHIHLPCYLQATLPAAGNIDFSGKVFGLLQELPLQVPSDPKIQVLCLPRKTSLRGSKCCACHGKRT